MNPVADSSLASSQGVPPHPAPAIPNFEMLRVVGSGSYGEVWLARNVMGALRAVKVIWRRQFESDRPYDREFAGIQRYEPVSRSSGGLVHVLHVGRNDPEGYFFYVMELADCAVCLRDIDPDFYIPRTLAYELDTRRRLPVRESLGLALELSEALGYLNRAGLRPRNTRLWQLPYYSPYQRMKVALIELENVEPVNQPVAR